MEQHFNVTVARTASSILVLSVGGILIPTAFTWGDGASSVDGNGDERLSYGTAIIMLLVYGAYLLFQLKMHREIYNIHSKKIGKRKGAKKSQGDVPSSWSTASTTSHANMVFHSTS